MKSNKAISRSNRSMKSIAIGTALSVGAFGLAGATAGPAFGAPDLVASASATSNSFTVARLANGKYKVSLNLADNQKGKTVYIKTTKIVNGRSVTTVIGKVKVGTKGQGSITVSRPIAAGSSFIVTSGSQLLIQRRVMSVVGVAPVTPTPTPTPTVTPTPTPTPTPTVTPTTPPSAGGGSGSVSGNASPVLPADTTAPTLSSQTVVGSTVVLTFSEALQAATLVAGDFTVLNGLVADVVTGVVVDGPGKTVTLTLTAPVANGDTVTVDYAASTSAVIQDVAGNDAAAITAAALTNNTQA